MQARHKDFQLQLDETQINISSNFDSGNLQKCIVSGSKIILTPSLDPMHPQYSIKPSSKTFFHFSLKATSHIKIPIVVQRMKILGYFSNEEQFQEFYRVCIGRKNKKVWSSQPLTYEKVRLPYMKRVEVEGSYQLHFQLQVNEREQIFVAYHFPYSYEQLQDFLHQTQERITTLNILDQKNPKYSYTNELLIQSLEGRAINLITLTDFGSGKTQQQQQRISKSLFPYFQLEPRPQKFNKPYILLTCRVHPGQTSASFAFQGILNFLLSSDPRARLLLQSFVFLLIPMLNPDGVYHGTYRMDSQGHNLNRFYNTALSHKQPSIFAVQTLASYYQNRIIFFMDLHSHPHPSKGSFIYGNCLPHIQEQTQSQLFAKLLNQESSCFGYNWCSFSNNQMNSRDTNELLTKDGSARVQLYKVFNIPFAYTMEMGYHGCNVKNAEQGYKGSHQREQKVFSVQDYQEHGKSIMIVLLKMFMLNANNKNVKNNDVKHLQSLREEVCRELVEKEERFRQMDGFIYKKIKVINQLINEQYYEQFYKKYPLVENIMKRGLATAESQDSILSYHGLSCNLDEEGHGALIQKRQLSLKVKRNYKTLDPSPNKGQQCPLRSFKSTFQPKRQRQYNQIGQPIIKKGISNFVRQLNLNFNPFPQIEQKKIYNVLGFKPNSIAKNIRKELEFQGEQNFDIETIAFNSQFDKIQQNFKSQEQDVLRSFRLNCFSPKPNIQNQEQAEPFDDGAMQRIQQPSHSMLPRIPNKSQRTQRVQKMLYFEAQFQRQDMSKASVRDSPKKDNPVYVKSALRANSLRIRNNFKLYK